jgi:prepilin-type N-terminal cleavage/methylation domain-containing protein
MRHFNVRNLRSQRGFTLPEILAALTITGILSALAMPNYLAWVNRNKVQQTAETVQGALQDAQRQAIRLGRNCRVELASASGSPASVYDRLQTPTIGCLVATGDSRSLQLANGIRMVTNIAIPTGTTAPGVEFSFRGHVAQPDFSSITTAPADSGKDFPMVVVYATPDNSATPYPTQQRRCVVVASLLGAVRVGVYDGPLASLDARQCQTNLEGTVTPGS